MTSKEPGEGYSKYGAVESETYDALREHEALWRFENAFVADYFAAHAPSALLDLPVGTGRFMHLYPKTTQVMGIDISDHMLAEAERKRARLGLDGVRLQRGNVFALDVEDGRFDTIVCWRLLHLLPEDKLVPALVELRRVLRGTLIAQAYVHGSPLRRFASRAARLAARTLRLAQPQHPLRSSDHISTYNHSRAVFDAAFAAAGLRARARHLLGHYYVHDVVAFVLEPA
jgi:2-polyprenyl-3-methyl-5-hydroxy-6-metoxy-1,4-benzoquinol methylase